MATSPTTSEPLARLFCRTGGGRQRIVEAADFRAGYEGGISRRRFDSREEHGRFLEVRTMGGRSEAKRG